MKLTSIAIAALLSISTPALVFAQSQTPAPQDASSTTGADKADAPGEPKLQDDFNQFLRTFETADFTSANSQIGAATTFNIVRLSTLENADGSLMAGATEPRSEDLTGMRTQLSANAGATAALQADGLTADQVVWIENGADGAVTLYVSDF